VKKLIVFLLVFVSCVLSAQDVVMVWNKSATLYSEKGRALLEVKTGTLVSVKIHPKDETRYLVTHKGKTYMAHKRSFRPLDEVTLAYKKTLLDLDGLEGKNNLRLSNIASELTVFFVQSLELRRDTAVAYQQSRSVVHNGNTVFIPTYTTLLSSSKFKKLMKAWKVDVEKLNKEKLSLLAQNKKVFVKRSQVKGRLASMDSQLKKFAEDKVSTTMKLYVVKDNIPLFIENKVKKYIKKGMVLEGKVHPRHKDWYLVKSAGKVYNVAGTGVVVKDAYQNYLSSKTVSATKELESLAEEIQTMQFRLKLYQGITRQLEANQVTQNGYSQIKDLIVAIDKVQNFTIKTPHAMAAYLNVNKAKKVLAVWTEEVVELTQRSLNAQKRTLQLKKALLDYEKAKKDLVKAAI